LTIVRQLALVALVIGSACGRSILGTRADAGSVGVDAFEPGADLAARDGAVDASVDLRAREPDAGSACSYEVGERYVVSCGGGYQFVTEMSGGWDCSRYFVYESTHRAYDLLGDLWSENGCVPSCLFEADIFDVVDCGGRTDHVVVPVVTGYADHFRDCPLPMVWYSDVTGKFCTTHDEARAILPACVDAGR
jgi:hypothetical protein